MNSIVSKSPAKNIILLSNINYHFEIRSELTLAPLGGAAGTNQARAQYNTII
jgi:hypothetical protein